MQGRGEGEDAGSEEPRFLFDMGDEDQQRRAGPLPEQAGDPLPQGRIDAGEGFVEKEEIGVHGKRPCDGDTLLLSAGELGRVGIGLVAEPDAV